MWTCGRRSLHRKSGGSHVYEGKMALALESFPVIFSTTTSSLQVCLDHLESHPTNSARLAQASHSQPTQVQAGSLQVRATGSQAVRLVHSSRLMWHVGGGLSTGTSAAVPLALSPKVHNPVSP